MRLAKTFVAFLLALVGRPHPKATPAKPLHALSLLPAPPVWVRAATPLPMLPGVSRVRVEVARDRVVVNEEVSLPRGEWTGGGLDLRVAFGSPGTPLAIDAQIGPAAPGASEARPDVSLEPVLVEATGGTARALLGSPRMAGVVVCVKESQLRRAYAASDVALLRVRSLLPLPAPDPSGRRDVVVRLGAPDGTPITLGKIQLVSLESKPWIARAEATLCGADADPWPLAVSLTPRPSHPVDSAGRPIVPAMAVRHAGDDLCLRWWSAD
jgi:hypothetical protein